MPSNWSFFFGGGNPSLAYRFHHGEWYHTESVHLKMVLDYFWASEVGNESIFRWTMLSWTMLSWTMWSLYKWATGCNWGYNPHKRNCNYNPTYTWYGPTLYIISGFISGLSTSRCDQLQCSDRRMFQDRKGGIHGDEQLEKTLVALVTLLKLAQPQKIGLPKKKRIVSQPPICRGELFLSGRVGRVMNQFFVGILFGCAKKLGNG